MAYPPPLLPGATYSSRNVAFFASFSWKLKKKSYPRDHYGFPTIAWSDNQFYKCGRFLAFSTSLLGDMKVRSIKDQKYEFEKHIQKPSVAYLHHRFERHSVLKMLPLLSLPAFLDDFSLAEEKRELETGQGKKFLEKKFFVMFKHVQPHLEATQQKFLEKTCSATFRSHPAPNIASGDVRQYLAVQLWWLTCLGGLLAFLLEFYTFFSPDPIMVGWFVQLWLILVWVLSCFFCYCPLLNKVACVIIGVTEITTII